MKTITYKEFAELTVAFIAHDESTLDTCALLAAVTVDMIPEEDQEEFMELVIEASAASLLKVLAK